MMYDVDVQRIEQQLQYLERCRHVLQPNALHTKDDQSLFLFTRAIHIAVECMIDVGTVMIDGFIMRDPGGYQDIVDILQDEKVIPGVLAKKISRWVDMRDRLIRHYVGVELVECDSFLTESEMLYDFQVHVRNYLRQELK